MGTKIRTREYFMAVFMAAGIEEAVISRWMARIGVGDLIRIEDAFKYRVPRVLKLMPRQEWGSEDPWLYKFLQEQKTFDERYREQLENHRFWEELSESINGLDLQQCQREFAKMGLWIRENPRRRPTVVGVRRFVASWFQRSYERERRQMPVAR